MITRVSSHLAIRVLAAEQARQAVLRKERTRLSLRWQGQLGARRTPRQW
jgi:hypothetical protein